jgi:hypothetical protein
MLITPEDKHQILTALDLLRKRVESFDVVKSCESCEHLRSGCMFTGEVMMPPEDVKKAGCKQWIWDGIPF